MEQQLFTWHGGWDQHDTMSFAFYNTELIVDLPNYPKGTKFNSIFIDYGLGTMTCYNDLDDEKPAVDFKLKLSVEL